MKSYMVLTLAGMSGLGPCVEPAKADDEFPTATSGAHEFGVWPALDGENHPVALIGDVPSCPRVTVQLGSDCYVDWPDFVGFMGQWLQCVEPTDGACE